MSQWSELRASYCTTLATLGGGCRRPNVWRGRNDVYAGRAGPRRRGRTYATFDNGTFNAVDWVPGACYAAGAQSRMARLLVER